MAKEVVLKSGVKRGEEVIKSITLREPVTGDLRGLDTFDILRMSINAHRTLVPRISNITAVEYDKLKPIDLTNVQSEVVGFFTEQE